MGSSEGKKQTCLALGLYVEVCGEERWVPPRARVGCFMFFLPNKSAEPAFLDHLTTAYLYSLLFPPPPMGRRAAFSEVCVVPLDLQELIWGPLTHAAILVWLEDRTGNGSWQCCIWHLMGWKAQSEPKGPFSAVNY